MIRPSNSVRGPVGSTVLQQIAAKHHTSKNSQHGASVLLVDVLIVHNNLWPHVAAVISDLLHRYGRKVLLYSHAVLLWALGKKAHITRML